MLPVLDFLIVEDEFLIAESIYEILVNAGYSQIRMADSFDDAIKQIEDRKPSIVLTDINLGNDKTGIDLGNLLYSLYHIPFIYITSHSSPEIVGKAKHTWPNAYIIKPFKNEDLLVAIEFALFNSTQKTENDTDTFELVVKEGRALVRLDYSKITWLESEGNYTTINLYDTKRRVVRMTLSELQQQLPDQQFLRIHKSFVVNKKYITELRANSVMILNKEFPIGRVYQQGLASFFSL